MINDILLYLGSIIIIIWGLAHIIPTKSIVSDFGKISEDNKKIITMEWIAEGLTLIFIGDLAIVVTYLESINCNISIIVYQMSAVMLFVMAGLTALTGARTKVVFFKLCPLVKSIVAILFILGSIL